MTGAANAIAGQKSVPLLAFVSIGILLAALMLGLHPAVSLAGAPPAGAVAIEKSNDAGGIPVAIGTEVEYTYVVTNVGTSHLVITDLSDDVVGGAHDGEVACEPLVGPDADQGDDAQLSPQESWTFHCSTTLNETTTNEACVTADVTPLSTPTPGGPPLVQTFSACDQNTVEVTPGGGVGGGAGTPAPSVPNSATGPIGFNGAPAALLVGVVLLASLGTLAFANVRALRERR